jgi:hypothetical protein
MPKGHRAVDTSTEHRDMSKPLALPAANSVTTELLGNLAHKVANVALAGQRDGGTTEDLVAATKSAVKALAAMAPQNPIEALLMAQMLAVNNAAMTSLRLGVGVGGLSMLVGKGTPNQNGELANKLLRTFAMQCEALAKLRGNSQQNIRVEHVHVEAGGQAVVGAVVAPSSKGSG